MSTTRPDQEPTRKTDTDTDPATTTFNLQPVLRRPTSSTSGLQMGTELSDETVFLSDDDCQGMHII